MFPKFATNLFGHFPRSTGAAFRNGFFNSSQGPSAGGAKYNAGSRFYSYNGYNGAGRAVTQASALGQDDDRQPRLHRLSLLQRQAAIVPSASHPHLSRLRSNSTSAASAAPAEHGHAVEPLLSALPVEPDASSSASTSFAVPSTDPAAPQTVTDPTSKSSSQAQERAIIEELDAAVASGNYNTVVNIVEKFKSSLEKPSATSFNVALGSLLKLYTGNTPVTHILSAYNHMLDKDVMPNIRTYNIMIHALCLRDEVVQQSINIINQRMKRRAFHGPVESDIYSLEAANKALLREQNIDLQKLEGLRNEKNFNSALVLFQAVSQLRVYALDTSTYTWLLRACGTHKAVDAAIRVFAHYERYSRDAPTPRMYQALITVYAASRDIEGAREVFEEFKKQSAEGKVALTSLARDSDLYKPYAMGSRSGVARISQIRVWNEMIATCFRVEPPDPSAALALLEQMLDTPNGLEYAAEEPPLPNQETYNFIISGFLSIGDLDTALKWFDRLLKQTSSATRVFAPRLDPPRPNASTWRLIVEKLTFTPGKEGVDNLNRYWKIFKDVQWPQKLGNRVLQHATIVQSNLNYIHLVEAEGPMDRDEKIERINIIREAARFTYNERDGRIPLFAPTTPRLVLDFISVQVEAGQVEEAAQFVLAFVRQMSNALKLDLTDPESGLPISSEQKSEYDSRIRVLLVKSLPIIFKSLVSPYDLRRMLEYGIELMDLGVGSIVALNPTIRRLWIEERQKGVPYLSPRQWSDLIYRLTYRFSKPGGKLPIPIEATLSLDIPGLITDFANTGIDLDHLRDSSLQGIVFGLYSTLGVTRGEEFLKNLGPRFQKLMKLGHKRLEFVQDTPLGSMLSSASPAAQEYDAPVLPAEAGEEGKHPVIDFELSRSIDEYYPVHRTLTPYDGLQRLEEGLQRGLYPRPEVVGRLINTLGRLKQLDKVKQLYNLSQNILITMEDNKQEQSLSWFQVEDHMIIALAHGGDLEAAHNHRQRILAQGGAPSSDAYGALISGIKDTTDDVMYALTLWQESQERGVTPNLFLYNTIISRLARGRKAEQALELFQQMKESRIFPSTVTYGAVITACCRVGDAVSAETLFDEMTRSRKYTPRVPPFNTIMQLFVTTKPDREKVLRYYGKMRSAGVHPSEHTYKLLLDAYGTVQPIDLPGMESVFAELQKDRRVSINGSHNASRINAYGCVNRDLDKAIQTFNEIESDGSRKLPDAICFEALFNVFVTHHRVDLFPEYLDRMAKMGVHTTAYCYNLMIKGYAAADDIVKAREIFESMADPAFGVAAPDNHVPYEPQQVAHATPSDAPVYREPSTWEAMVRAELGSNNRQEALALIERMHTRGYPTAVLNRVNGILHDESTSSSVDDASSPLTASDTPPTSSSVSTPPPSVF